MSRANFAVCLLLATACSSKPIVVQDTNTFDVAHNNQLLIQGLQTLSKNVTRANRDYFDLVVENCRAAFPAGEHRYYVTRSPEESLYYLAMSATKEESASVIDVPCAHANYLKGYASIDSGDLGAARTHLAEAVRWSPAHPLYRSEIGHLHQLQRDWQGALDSYVQAEKFAETFSPDEVKVAELSRAKRGVGFALIELGKLNEAEKKFRECLEMDSEDEKAKHELAYIERLRATMSADGS